jgi:hypothetical protein
LKSPENRYSGLAITPFLGYNPPLFVLLRAREKTGDMAGHAWIAQKSKTGRALFGRALTE